MALRVLLADESSTIKKVFQLALQDFAVEVRPVNIGVDVAPVAKAFQPDIIFIDVLLQKKNGYDVSAELKASAELGNVPIVLMWSGFMELDEDKFQASAANGRLEKPFDVTTLRKLVTDLVPKTQSQRLSQFLSFPKMPELDDKKGNLAPPPLPKQEEEFQQVSIPKMKGGADRFRIPVGTEDDPEIPVSLQMPTDPIDVDTIFRDVDGPEDFQMRETKTPTIRSVTPPPPPVHHAPPPPPQAATIPQWTEADIEKIVRSQSKEIIESVVWRVLPELAQQIIEREIEKLLKEKDASLYR